MRVPRISFISFFFSRRRGGSRDEKGFASAEWAVLMAMTVVLLATLAQGLIIENVRSTTLASLRDAARAGTQVTDFRKGGTADGEAICLERLKNSLKDLTGSNGDDAKCQVIQINGTGPYYMKASVGDSIKPNNIVPWAAVFNPRVKNLNAVFVQTESAK